MTIEIIPLQSSGHSYVMSSVAGITYSEYSLHSDRIIIPTLTAVTGPY